MGRAELGSLGLSVIRRPGGRDGGEGRLKRVLRGLYAPTRTPAVVEVPEMAFLMIDGHGDPNTSARYRDSVSALFSVAYSPVRAQAGGGDRLRRDAARGSVVCARHGDLLDRGQVRVGLDHDDHAADEVTRRCSRTRRRARLRRSCRRSIGCGWGGCRGTRCAGAARRPLQRRGADDRLAAPVHRRARPSSPASTMRSTSATRSIRAGEAEDHHPPADALRLLTLPGSRLGIDDLVRASGPQECRH